MIVYKELDNDEIVVYLDGRRVGKIVKVFNVDSGFWYQYRTFSGYCGDQYRSIHEVKLSIEF